MTDIILEILRTVVVGFILLFLLSNKQSKSIRTIPGWNYIIGGFCLIFIGMVIDITDNFDSLNRFIIIGDTPPQAFIEKVVGYLFGFVLLAAGIWQWIPGIIELETKRHEELDKAAEKIKALTGLLPICMDCKKYRDNSGYWNQIETYISEHTEAELSHSICDECLAKRYPVDEE